MGKLKHRKDRINQKQKEIYSPKRCISTEQKKNSQITF